MIPGECRESLALQTALDCGIPHAIVARANALLEEQTSIPLVKLSKSEPTIELIETQGASSVRPRVDSVYLKSLLAESTARALPLENAEVIYVGPNQTPPIGSAGQTCVYILRRGDGWCYCGESDHLPTRLATHRQSSQRLIELVYVAVPKEAGGKSAARALESRVIQALQRARVPLWSDQDAAHKHFGAAG
jgi:predicted GIY-YIG superfamily endonuclease